MGMDVPAKKEKPKPSPTPKPKPKPRDTPNGEPREGPKGKFQCYNCDSEEHGVDKCPTVPVSRRSWTPAQWRAELKKNPRTKSPAKNGSGNRHPGGGTNPKASLQSGGSLNDAKEDGQSTSIDPGGTNAYADGPATVAGVSGFWTADGGCNKATISHHYAQKLASTGVEVFTYDQ